MKLEIKDKFVEALRSGSYEKGKFHLRSKDGKFCANGVLCHLAQLAGVVQCDDWGLAYGYDGEINILPTSVMQWAGVSTITMSLPREIALSAPEMFSVAEMNDGDFTFDEIADVLETCWEQI